MPVEPNVCLGNGEHGFECCCDECDYCLFCFPELDKKNEMNEVMLITNGVRTLVLDIRDADDVVPYK